MRRYFAALFPRSAAALRQTPERLGLFAAALFTLVLSFPETAVAEAAPGAEPPSFVGYRIEPQKLQPLIRPFAEQAAGALEAAAKAGAKKTAAGRLRAAAAEGEKLSSDLPRGYHDELYFILGLLYERLGEPKKALSAYERSNNLKTDPITLFHQAALLKNEARCNEAVPKLKEVLWLTKSNTHEVLHLAAQCLLELGKKPEALKLIEQAYQENRNYLPTLRLLVTLRREMLDEAETRQEREALEAKLAADLSLITKLDENDREAGLMLGKMLLQKADPLLNQERIVEAGAIASRFAERSAYKDDESVKLLFDAQVKRGNLSGAEETLTKGLAARPDSELLLSAKRQLDIQKAIEQPKDDVAG